MTAIPLLALTLVLDTLPPVRARLYDAVGQTGAADPDEGHPHQQESRHHYLLVREKGSTTGDGFQMSANIGTLI